MHTIAMYLTGRWGNMLFQDAFARVLAACHADCRLMLPEWPGKRLFGLFDELPWNPTSPHRIVDERLDGLQDPATSELAQACRPGAGLPFMVDGSDVPLLVAAGFFQFHTRFYHPHREMLRRVFIPVAELQHALAGAKKRVFGDEPFLALHLRKGDFLDPVNKGGLFEAVPDTWYQKWLSTMLESVATPNVYVATDASENPAASWNLPIAPKWARDLGVQVPAAPYLPDWWMLGAADVVCIANSSFSFSATMFGSHPNQKCWRPDRAIAGMRAYDPWDDEVLLHRGGRGLTGSQPGS